MTLQFYVEVAVNTCRHSRAVPPEKLRETELWGKHGTGRQRCTALKKLTWLRRSRTVDGSPETVLRAAQTVHGFATTLRNVRQAHYCGASQALMANASSVAVNWGGSCHGGLSVNMGLLMDAGARCACYLAPAVGYVSDNNHGQVRNINTRALAIS